MGLFCFCGKIRFLNWFKFITCTNGPEGPPYPIIANGPADYYPANQLSIKR